MAAPRPTKDNSPPRPMTAHNNLHALLFNATSAEYYALTTQIYNLARHAVLERLRAGTFRNPTIIMDLDETVLDNSAYQAWLIASGSNYHDGASWDPWCQAGEAAAVPGAIEFIHFARGNGATVFFVSSRNNATREGTARNLHLLGLISEQEFIEEKEHGAEPENAWRTHLFLKGMPPTQGTGPQGPVNHLLGNKFLQRQFCEVGRGHEVILSIGDNLADWAEYYGNVFDANGNVPDRALHPTPQSRLQSAKQDSQLFGRDFILLPNASYGGWLRAFEAQKLGASDEFAYSPKPVREELREPQDPFHYDEGKSETAAGPKLSATHLRIWSGP